MADPLGGQLIDRDAGAEVGAVGLPGVAAGQEAGHGAGVIAAAVAVGTRRVQGQATQDEDVVLDRLQRLEDRRQIEKCSRAIAASSRACGRRWGRRGMPCARESDSGRPQPARAVSTCIASSNGKATRHAQTPQDGPSRYLARLTHGCRLLDSRVTKRFAFDDGKNQGREPVVVAGEPGDDLVDGAAVGSVEAAAQGVGEHLLGEAAGERIAARPGARSSARRDHESSPAGQMSRGIDRLVSVRGPPAADGVEVLEAEAERVHAAVARGTGRVGPVPFHPLAERARATVLVSFLESLHARRRGRGGVPRMFSRIHLPRLTGEVRSGWTSPPERSPGSARRPAACRRARLGENHRP